MTIGRLGVTSALASADRPPGPAVDAPDLAALYHSSRLFSTQAAAAAPDALDTWPP